MTRSSLSASRSSGLPARYDFIWMQPSIVAFSTWPFGAKSTESRSRMSTKISFFVFAPTFAVMGLCALADDLVLAPIALVAAAAAWAMRLSTMMGSLYTNALRFSVEVVCAYPKSITSSSSS